MINHIVSFKYKEDVSQAEKERLASKGLAMKETAVRNGEKYILDIVGGANNSPEGKSQGFEHLFVLTFADEAGRKYYIDECPAHKEFKEALAGKVVGVFVFDFIAGEFACE